MSGGGGDIEGVDIGFREGELGFRGMEDEPDEEDDEEKATEESREREEQFLATVVDVNPSFLGAMFWRSFRYCRHFMRERGIELRKRGGEGVK